MNKYYENDVTLTNEEMTEVSGAGLFYDLGAFFADVANAGDSIYAQYGNTNMNHHW
ncbi:hypothetical protein [Alteromonas antoniana]|uniref:hypothetical protein n=1 Tax=Alteromonas antoniana TaxID=2803813 RepID=UPI001C495C2F|nr:hypothetical protein [Alteromonas antoniana]